MMTLLLGLAFAQTQPEDLRWTWDEPRTYLISTEVRAESVFWVGAIQNTEARMVDLTIHLVTTCEAVDRWREDRRFLLRCDFDDLTLTGRPFAGDAPDALQRILVEWTETLEDGGWMQVSMRDDGRVTGMSLEGVNKDQPRLGAIHTVMHMWLSRAFAGFDLTLPHEERLSDTMWLDLHLSRAYHFPRVDGSFGAAETVHLLDGAPRDGLQRILTQGNALVERRSGVGDAQYVSLLDGVAHFDIDRGALTSRWYAVFSEPTASHTLAEGMYFNAGQRLHMRWIEPGDVPPRLPESGTR